MTSWELLGVFRDVLIQYYFGSPIMFYAGLVILFIMALSLSGVDIRLAIIFSLPLVATFTINGVWGAYTWVTNLVLMFVALIYAYALIELFT